MLNYTSLFDDLEELFHSTGEEPASFRRLSREVERVHANLADYYDEVAIHYVLRLERRLSQANPRLSAEEVTLLRGYLRLAPKDPERNRRLLNDLAQLEAALGELLDLKGRPLSLKNLDGLRRLLGRMAAVTPGIILVLEEQKRAQAFERAVGPAAESAQPAEVADAPWLLNAVRRILVGSSAAPTTEDSSAY